MTPHMFGIGAGKSGGHTLARAIELLGLKAAHIGHETFHGRPHIQETILANVAGERPVLTGIDGYDALVDWPVCEYWYLLREQYPDAKFILTYRPPHDCAMSWTRMCLAQKALPAGAPGDYAAYAAYVEEHVAAVCRGFMATPDRLLILDMREAATAGWKLLSRFLGLKPPAGVPFPKEFTYEELL